MLIALLAADGLIVWFNEKAEPSATPYPVTLPLAELALKWLCLALG